MPRALRTSIAALVFALAAAAAATACVREATQVQLTITTDVPAARAMRVRVLLLDSSVVDLGALARRTDWITFEVGPPAPPAPSAADGGARDGGRRAITLPASIGLVPEPGGTRDTAATLVVEGHVDPDLPGSRVIRRIVTFQFARNRSMALAVNLALGCLDPETGCLREPCTWQQYCEDNNDTCSDDGDDCVERGALLHPRDGGVCNPGQALCANACVNLAVDLDNCGACGRACDNGQGCAGGRCL